MGMMVALEVMELSNIIALAVEHNIKKQHCVSIEIEKWPLLMVNVRAAIYAGMNRMRFATFLTVDES